jgi:hypothetical protein
MRLQLKIVTFLGTLSLAMGAATPSDTNSLEERSDLPFANHWESIYNAGVSLSPSLQNIALTFSAVYFGTLGLPFLLTPVLFTGTHAAALPNPNPPAWSGVFQEPDQGKLPFIAPQMANIAMAATGVYFGKLGLPLLLATLATVNAEPAISFEGISDDRRAGALEGRETVSRTGFIQFGGGAALLPSLQNMALAFASVYFGTLGLPILLANLAFASAELVIALEGIPDDNHALESRQTDGPANLFQLGGSSSLLPSLQSMLFALSAVYISSSILPLLANIAFAAAAAVMPIPILKAQELETRQDMTPYFSVSSSSRSISPFSPPLFAAAVIAGGLMYPLLTSLFVLVGNFARANAGAVPVAGGVEVREDNLLEREVLNVEGRGLVTSGATKNRGLKVKDLVSSGVGALVGMAVLVFA